MIKQFLKKVTPKFLRSLKRERHFRFQNGGSDFRAKQALVSRYGKQVIAGPFQGMIYGDSSTGSAYIAKLVGSYEEELHPTIETILAKNPSTVIDVGCAEGYYAVGFAKRLPSAKIYAFDINPDAREYCLELAKLNGSKNQVQVRGFCNPEVLGQMTSQPAFILGDCEGYEVELFAPALVPTLKQCDFLIEFHDFMVPNASQTLRERFADTHSIQIIDTQPRDISRYECLSDVPVPDREAALSEKRPCPMQWGYFQALAR